MVTKQSMLISAANENLPSFCLTCGCFLDPTCFPTIPEIATELRRVGELGIACGALVDLIMSFIAVIPSDHRRIAIRAIDVCNDCNLAHGVIPILPPSDWRMRIKRNEK